MHILAFFAHPDDETMLCGGTLAALAAEGHAVHIVLATRGEGGEMGEPALCEVEQLGTIREAEARCAAAHLGSASLEFLPYIDPRVGPDNSLYAYNASLEKLTLELQDAIRAYDCQALISHGSNGEYGHPAHLLSHQAAKLAAGSFAGQISFYSVQGAYAGHPKPKLMNKDDEAHLILDLSAVLDKKTAAVQCHATQHALFLRNASKAAGRQLTLIEAVLAEESLHRVLPSYQADDEDPLFAMLAKYQKPVP